MTSKASHTGILYGIAAYGLWGLIPLYFKSVAHVAPLEILAHRALWSFVMLAILVRVLNRWREVGRGLCNGRLMLMLGLTTLLLAANWLTFIYSVLTKHVLQASLGYFINPLVNVLLGVLFLRERLRPWQVVSIVLALIGVVVLTTYVGQVPWIALTLATTFGLYALLRKLMSVDGLVSLAVETLVLLPIALVYLSYLGATGIATGRSSSTLGLLLLSGPVTTVPLLFFGAAARRLRLSTLGIVQYLTPSLHFLLAVFAFREPFSMAQVASFACIWTAIAIYTADSFRALRQARQNLIEPAGADL